MKINLTIPVIVCLVLISSCCGCGSGWKNARIQQAQLDALKEHTIAVRMQTEHLSSIAESLRRMERNPAPVIHPDVKPAVNE